MIIYPVSLLTALQHSDSFFPSGSFAFSQGLEASIALAETLGPCNFREFVVAQVLHRWAGGDRVAMLRAHRLTPDLPRVAELDLEVDASTVASGFRRNSRRNGMALLTAHARLGTAHAAEFRDMVQKGRARGHFAVAQGVVLRVVGLDERTAAAISGYQAVASLATAAVRLGFIGVLEAQSEIARVLPIIARCCGVPVDDDQPLETFVPLCEIAVARHGALDQRLFSN